MKIKNLILITFLVSIFSCEDINLDTKTINRVVETKSSIGYNTETWQYVLNDEESVSNIFLPGTHDTGAYRRGGALVRTQKISIEDQLEEGVRAFDIRLRAVSNSKMEIYHGISSQGLYFQEDILRNCISFLKDNPSEFLIMTLKKERNDKYSAESYENQVLDILDKPEFKPYLMDEFKTDLKVKDIRGKILILHRSYIENNSIGGYLQGWKDDASFQATITTKHQNENAKLYVEDEYKVYTIFNIDEKLQTITKNLYLSTQKKNNENWFITYASGTGLGAYPCTVADKINPKITTFIKENQYKFKGILFLDFVKQDDKTIQQIIQNNFN